MYRLFPKSEISWEVGELKSGCSNVIGNEAFENRNRNFLLIVE